MICFPNAKINLGLNIVSHREDGFHNLETIFYPIGLKDALEIVPKKDSSDQKRYRFFQSGMQLDTEDENNLVIKAYKLLANYKEIPDIDIHLLKKIPSGAGLGGGSSDAAFMLKLLNDTFKFGYPLVELENFASQLGSDCPFFIQNKPVFATGTGNIFEDIELDLSSYHFLLVKPDINISTKDAFSLIKPSKPIVSLKDIISKPVSEWKEFMKNDFEISVFEKFPEICNIKEKMYDSGALYASMSGSGSAVYGIFECVPENLNEIKNDFVWSNKID